MLIVDNKEYRNIQQQVAENANDIAELKDDKQDTLVSGTNIKTINGTSVLGSGDIQIGEGGTTVTGGTGIIVSSEGEISIDTSVVAELSDIPTYTGGTGIDITNDVVSVNNNVAMKSDIPSYSAGTGISLTNNVIAVNNNVALKTDIPTYTGGTGININSNNVVSIDNAVALKTDIPNYTGGSGITINSGNVVSADSTLARVADIPSITGLTMYNYKITISGVDGGTSNTRSAVYIVTLPYQWDYSSLSKIEIIRLIPVWSVVVDTATTNSKIMGRFHWQTSAISLIDWVDGTHTVMDFTGSFNATISAAAPAHW